MIHSEAQETTANQPHQVVLSSVWELLYWKIKYCALPLSFKHPRIQGLFNGNKPDPLLDASRTAFKHTKTDSRGDSIFYPQYHYMGLSNTELDSIFHTEYGSVVSDEYYFVLAKNESKECLENPLIRETSYRYFETMSIYKVLPKRFQTKQLLDKINRYYQCRKYPILNLRYDAVWEVKVY